MPWKPMGAQPDFHEVLVESVEPWMEEPLAQWFLAFFPGSLLQRLAIDFDSAARNDDPLQEAAVRGYRNMRRYMDEDDLISLIDYAVYRLGSEPSWGEQSAESVLAILDDMLLASGSVWRVGAREGLPGLERRVPAGVQEAADEAMKSSGSGGLLLSEAWHAAFGRAPDPEEAYEKAIKAVEEAGAKLVLPKDTTATLGKMITTMIPHGNWTIDLVDGSGAYFNDVVLQMCQALWKGQRSRHGANGYRKPTQSEAEAAVLLAVPLVQWFYSGAVARRP